MYVPAFLSPLHTPKSSLSLPWHNVALSARPFSPFLLPHPSPRPRRKIASDQATDLRETPAPAMDLQNTGRASSARPHARRTFTSAFPGSTPRNPALAALLYRRHFRPGHSTRADAPPRPSLLAHVLSPAVWDARPPAQPQTRRGASIPALLALLAPSDASCAATPGPHHPPLAPHAPAQR